MALKTKSTFALSLAAALLLSSCTSTGQIKANHLQSMQTNKNYTFPKEVFEGFWAAESPIQNKAVVISLDKDTDTLFQFDCQPDGSFELVDMYVSELEASPTGMGLKNDDDIVWSELRVTQFVPKNSLTLHQSYITDSEFKRTQPNGSDFKYTYTPTLKPNCS